MQYKELKAATHQGVRKVFSDTVVRKIYKLYGVVFGWNDYRSDLL